MKTYKEFLNEAKIVGHIDLSQYKDKNNVDSGNVSQKDLNALEKILDSLFKSVSINIEFTRHFLDRVNDKRNKEQITIEELRILFKKTYDKYRNKLTTMGADAQAVLNDLQSELNLPFVLKWDKKNNELDLISKTIMRKKNFKTSNIKLKV